VRSMAFASPWPKISGQSGKKPDPSKTSHILVLFLPRPQNHARKSLCNLRTLKSCRVDFMQQQRLLIFILRELFMYS
jgi:hypothetical protein